MTYFFIDLIYIFFIILALPFYLVRFLASRNSRLGLAQRFGFVPRRPEAGKPLIWLHGASVGEMASATLLIQRLRETYPDYELLLSTLTPTAHLILRKKYPDINAIFFPIDLSWIVRRVLKRLKPNLIILLEQEIWPNFTAVAAHRKIPIVLLNARITDRSFKRYRKSELVFKPVLQEIRYFGVQSQNYAERYTQLGVPPERVRVTGNMKYDTVSKSQAPMTNFQNELGIKDGELVLVGGSTHAPEEEVILEAYRMLKTDFPNLRLILAPRHPERFSAVENLIKSKGFNCRRRSRSAEIANNQSEIILLDTIGELVQVYRLATMVVVGGSFVPRGGQNLLEPAALAKPVVFGPSIYNFQEGAELLMKAGAGFMVTSPAELLAKLKMLLGDLAGLSALGGRGQAVVSAQQGATERNLEIVQQLISPTFTKDLTRNQDTKI